MDDEPPSPVHEGATRTMTIVAALAVFFLIVGLPAILYAVAGQTRVAVALVVIFVAMLLVSAYALNEAVKARRNRP